MRFIHALLIVACVTALAGCTTSGRDEAAETGDSEHQAQSRTSEQVAPATGETMKLVGNLGCSHCTFHANNSCATAIKTAGVVDLKSSRKTYAIQEPIYVPREFSFLTATTNNDIFEIPGWFTFQDLLNVSPDPTPFSFRND